MAFCTWLFVLAVSLNYLHWVLSEVTVNEEAGVSVFNGRNDRESSATEVDLGDVAVAPSIAITLPPREAKTNKLVRKTADLLRKSNERLFMIPEDILQRLVDISDRLLIQPTPSQRNKVNAFTVRLFLTVDSSNDPDGTASSIRYRYRTQTTTTFYTASHDDEFPMTHSLPPSRLEVTAPIATTLKLTTIRNDSPVTVEITTFMPIQLSSGWTQSYEKTEFRWTKMIA
ncbi:hypothetical protein RvY_07338 [Ramazzottius varieornatus]|uniref:TGF-beta propeptide domain-containing protein n=1 Tax=Ramazzottius varieornatus TaxID=947166 RepID=A0A1D1V1Z9_RAMVA|nr:hypothetical protein RvY_07338 [Ramazzottius varieornatus]